MLFVSAGAHSQESDACFAVEYNLLWLISFLAKQNGDPNMELGRLFKTEHQKKSVEGEIEECQVRFVVNPQSIR